MCNCVQKSRTSLGFGKGFHYKFECTDNAGKTKNVELDASNDSIAKQLAELQCSGDLKLIADNEIPKNEHHLTFTSFCLKEKMRRDNQGRIWGNWCQSFAAACIDLFDNRYIMQGSVISLREVGSCSQGKVIVMVETY